MEDKLNRLDFDAPLLSVRRFSAPPPPPPPSSAPPSAPRPPPPRRSSLPFYKSELISGPVRNAGVVPFVWEQTPGQPKTAAAAAPPSPPAAVPKLPPARISDPENKTSDEQQQQHEHEPEDDDDGDDDDAFSDAVNRLSRTESFFMNCSVSGLSDGAPPPPPPHSGSFATDPQVRDFMMGRFLPASQAAAISSPQCGAPRKQAARPAEREEGGDNTHRRSALPYGYGPNMGPRGDCYDDDDGYNDDNTSNLHSTGCGFLPRFCMKSSLFLLNPIPGMKVRSRLRPPPGRRISRPQTRATIGSLGQVEDENSWEAVYKHKLGHGGQQHQGEEGSRITSESNHLTYWSDSQTADGSSPHRHSNCGISPYRNEAPQSPFHEGKSFLGVPTKERKIGGSNGSDSCEKDSDNNSEAEHCNGSQRGSGAMSPAIDRAVYVDYVHLPEASHSKSSSVASNAEMKGVLKPTDGDSVVVVSQTMEDSLVLESSEKDALQPKISKLVGHMDGDDDGIKHKDSHAGPQLLEVEDQVKANAGFLPPLLPPPLPKQPSESWLCRTLPSVSSKNPPKQSFLGIQFQPRKQALRVNSTDQCDHKQEINEKPVKVQRQIRFADMLTRPISPESEI